MSLFIQKAAKEGKNEAWMYVLGTLASFIGGQFLGVLPLLYVAFTTGNTSPEAMTNPDALGIDRNLFLLMMLLPFVVSFGILWWFIRGVHKKRFLVSFTPFARFNWSRFFISFIVWFLLSGLFDVVLYLIDPSNYEFLGLDLHRFGPLFLISVLVLPIQTTYEELLLRSYLWQGLGIWKVNKLFPFLVTSSLFALLHAMNPEIQEYGYVVLVQYLSVSLLLGLLVMQSDSLELSMGAHLANNIYGSLITSAHGSALTTDSLFYIKDSSVTLTSISVYILLLIIFYQVMRILFKLPSLRNAFTKFDLQSSI